MSLRMFRPPSPARCGGGGRGPFVEGEGNTVEGLDGKGRRDVRCLGQAFRVHAGPTPPWRPWKPCRCSGPALLAPSCTGTSPAVWSALAAAMVRPLYRTDPWPMRGRARWDRGQRSPLAPTDPWQGTTGWMPRFSNATNWFRTARLMPECPRTRLLIRSSIMALVMSSGKGAPTPQAWLFSRFSCSSRRSFSGDVHRGEVAEAGGDAVDHVVGILPALNRRRRGLHPPDGLLVQFHGIPVPRDVDDTSSRVRDMPSRRTFLFPDFTHTDLLPFLVNPSTAETPA